MRFQCSNCDQIVSVDDSDLGSMISCGHCGQTEEVPSELFGPRVVISDYVIIKKIGIGRMASVYLAHQMSLDRNVALKILEQELADDSDFIMDFFREAKTAGKLNHPNIVQAYAVDEENGTYFIAMEHIQGRNLKQILEEDGPLPLDYALKILHQIAEALSFLWKGHKLCHENIKPENILITSSDMAKLGDLGLSKGHKRREVSTDYISPEKILGSKMDIRSDLYSLGITFYEALTGETPFDGESDEEIRKKHLKLAPIPASKLRKEIPESYVRIIDKLLAKHPDDRYQSPSELISDIKLARVTKTHKQAREAAKRAQMKKAIESKNSVRINNLKTFLSISLFINIILLVIILLFVTGKTPVKPSEKVVTNSEVDLYHQLAIEMNTTSLSTERAGNLLEDINIFISRYPESPHYPVVRYWKQTLEEITIRAKREELRLKELKEKKEASKLFEIVEDNESTKEQGGKKQKK
ncbi:MAG: protein kinase [Lentisphaeraceae bacterium]|nr:protein kinase [Lentisphaeraceae bacterium]